MDYRIENPCFSVLELEPWKAWITGSADSPYLALVLDFPFIKYNILICCRDAQIRVDNLFKTGPEILVL